MWATGSGCSPGLGGGGRGGKGLPYKSNSQRLSYLVGVKIDGLVTPGVFESKMTTVGVIRIPG